MVICNMVGMLYIHIYLYQPNVRKKAVMVFHRFYQLDPASASVMKTKIKRILCDKDPSVMSASLVEWETHTTTRHQEAAASLRRMPHVGLAHHQII